ncbi:MAG: alanine--tRNA ligase [Pseudomonadota bacterium]
MESDLIRQRFLEFFGRQGHTIRPSSPLVPKDDPSLLFTNAGMVQFKRVFLGEEGRPYVRAATSQKCMRAGGKHNDIENVGFTERHHTFFEMLGNFSFGDYFKRDAIRYAWELLTRIFGLPPELLWVTVYEDDDEAYAIWRDDIGMPEARIARMGAKDNFWAMGDTGPCGPCSEIAIDQGPEVGCRRPECGIHCDCDRYLELWNLVFMQFNRDEAGQLTPLPKPSIDTGMGLERIAAVLQGRHSNYESDLFAPILAAIERLSGRRSGSGDSQQDAAFKVIADHARALTFLIADGVLPSNEGRGYVLRRILRRAVRFGRLLGMEKPFLAGVCEAVRDKMAKTYPELVAGGGATAQIVTSEEERFSETLDFGLRLLETELSELRKQGARVIPGELIFRLYDTYGFPTDIINDMARTEGMGMDSAEFERLMGRQKEMSRQAGLGASEAAGRGAYRRLLEAEARTTFVGYETTTAESEVLLVAVAGTEVEAAHEGQEAEVVCARTPFYGASGGQVGDTGRLSWPGGEATVTDTQRTDGLVVHQVRILKGTLARGSAVSLEVDAERRQKIALNHTATHLLQVVLRRELGEHVKQAGSLVAPDRLRFDFTHFAPMEVETLRRIEDGVNAAIRADMPVRVRLTTYEEAVREGAMALFEDKYAEEVRLLSVGLEGQPVFSQELCGGTHARRTGEVGLCKIISEGGVAAGVRRIEALTGQGALEHLRAREDELKAAAGLLRVAPSELVARLEKLLAAQKHLERELEKARTSAFGDGMAEVLERNSRKVGDVTVLAMEVPASNAKELREMADKLRERVKSGVIVLGAREGGKAMLVALVSKDLSRLCSAADIAKNLAGLVGGTGGGRPDMAQAGGSRPEKLGEALDPDRVKALVVALTKKQAAGPGASRAGQTQKNP